MRSLIVVIIGLIIGGYIYSGSSSHTSTSRALRATSAPALAPAALPTATQVLRIVPTATAPAIAIVPTPVRLGCDPAYPEPRTCIPPGPPYNQGCAVTAQRLFKVLAPDPQHLDADGDGIGCEPIGGAPQAPAAPSAPDVQYRDCESSYPDVCIPPAPPDLSCDDVEYLWGYRDFVVYPPDTHNFDGDGDGWGCEPYGLSVSEAERNAYLEEQEERERRAAEDAYQDYPDGQDARDDQYDDYYEDVDYCDAHRCME